MYMTGSYAKQIGANIPSANQLLIHLADVSNINEENWMYQHAIAVRQFDSGLLQGRQVLSKGLRDPYSGVVFVPALTQPTHVEYKKIIGDEDRKKKLVYETVMKSDNLFKRTGLLNVPKEIFEGSVSEEVKNAILKQQAYEAAL